MSLPDTSNALDMERIGRLTVLRKARREAAQSLRDIIVPLLNSIEQLDRNWNVSGILELVSEITELNDAIRFADIPKRKKETA